MHLSVCMAQPIYKDKINPVLYKKLKNVFRTTHKETQDISNKKPVVRDRLSSLLYGKTSIIFLHIQ